MNPPVRDPHHREALWEGIVDGTVDCISTDHAPHTVQEKKEGAPLSAPSGVTGVETMLPLLLTVAAGKWPHPEDHPPISITPERIIELCHTNPNRIFNLEKEEIEEQSQSSIVIVDPEDEWKISASDLHYKCGWTPYEGWQVQGKVEEVL